jgi:hypothetical protein
MTWLHDHVGVAIWIALLTNTASFLLGLHTRRKLRSQLNGLCFHSWMAVQVRHEIGDGHPYPLTVSLDRCSKCSQSRTAVYAGRWELADLQTPSVDELNRQFKK